MGAALWGQVCEVALAILQRGQEIAQRWPYSCGRKAENLEPENFDKEFIRLAYAEQGYRGDGEPMPLPTDLAAATAERYISCL